MAIPDAIKTATVAEQKALGVKLDSVVAGVGGQTEGATHGDGDTGVMVLAVRQDVAAALAADGKYIPFSVDEDGKLRVVGSFASVSNVEYAEDTAHITADEGNLVLGVRKDAAAPLADADGKYIPFIVDELGQLYIALPGTAEADIAAIKAAIEATLTVQATDLDVRALVNTDVVSVEQATHDSLNLNANIQIADADADVGAGDAGAATQRISIATDDVNLAAIKAAIEAALTVTAAALDIRALAAATDSVDANLQVADADADVGAGNAGAATQRVSIATDDANLAALKTALESLALAEDVAHSGGEKGVLSLAVRNDVLNALAGTDGDRSVLQVDENGALYTVPDRRGLLSVSGTQATATSTQRIAAPGANKAIYVEGAMLQQNGDAPTAQLVAIEDGTGGTEKANFRLSANDGAGAGLPFPVIIATNEALKLDSDQSQSFTYTISYRIIDV
jgi:hypothetical protein